MKCSLGASPACGSSRIPRREMVRATRATLVGALRAWTGAGEGRGVMK